MASRSKVVNALNDLKITPNHKQYRHYVEKEYLKELKISDAVFEKNEKEIKKVVNKFADDVKRFYSKQFSYNFNVMLNQKKVWFAGLITNVIPKNQTQTKPKLGRRKKKQKGRHKKDYSENKDTQQREKANKALGNNSFEEMIHGLIILASKQGLNDAAWVLKKLKESPTDNASKLRDSFENPVKPVIVMTPEECLATVIELKLTARHSIYIRTVSSWLPTLLNCFKMVLTFGSAACNCILDFCPGQQGRNQIYQS